LTFLADAVMIKSVRAIHWFRSDLRLRDNTALAAAAARADEMAMVFVFDDRLLSGSRVGPPRLRFLWDALERLGGDLRQRGHRLVLRRGDPVAEIPRLIRETGAELLSFNRDPGPYAQRRDARTRSAAERAGARVLDCKDRVLFESADLRTRKGQSFRVYTPFRRAWLARFREDRPLPAGPTRFPLPIPGLAAGRIPNLAEFGAAADRTRIPLAGEAAARGRLQRFMDGRIGDYASRREEPAVNGTSRLSPFLRFGLLSPRICAETALEVAAAFPGRAGGAWKWIDELIWREVYSAILEEHPHVLVRSFRPEYQAVLWEDDEDLFRAWCEGRTGYPFVDAAMRQLEREGWMHNRARMVVASFLTKDLLIDWRWGERFFMQRLVDGEPASNNGGWQWSASTGTDAQPYFRIFNPVAQGERFDPGGRYVRRFVPELRGVPDRHVHRPWGSPRPPRGYPAPIVDHTHQRQLALARYQAARRKAPRR
jgi:deoxyribodipyrimidine photo-lyase